MFKAYALLVLSLNPDVPSVVFESGAESSHCAEYVNRVTKLEQSDLVFMCIPQDILGVCEYEDSNNCVWNANVQGNGQGESFVNFAGNTFYEKKR